ncbi:AbgT family transporter [Steroidobacter flavus]|uniref:AbgT family transporter n=1 Tax=Steroidobacter flavus TaxID=1842136 RepID=A0ABV8T240_9GAMM
MNAVPQVQPWWERVAARVPDPVTIFVCLSVVTVAMSVWAASRGWGVHHPTTGEWVPARNLLAPDVIRHLLSDMPKIFTGYSPLGVALLTFTAAGFAEKSGFFGALVEGLARRIPAALLTPAISLLAILTHVGGDVGLLVLMPLAGIIYMSSGRHPVAGIAAVYASLSGGYSANFIITPTDAVLLGIANEAARAVDPASSLNIGANLFINMTFAVVVIAIVTFITDRIIEPRLRQLHPHAPSTEPRARPDRKAVIAATVTMVAVALGFVAMVLPGGPLRGESGDLEPFYHALVAMIFVMFVLSGIVFGVMTGKFKSDKDVVRTLQDSARELGFMIVLLFFVSYFLELLSSSNLTTILSVKGADALRAFALPPPLLGVSLILVASGLDLLAPAATAKWAMIAPAVVPMYMLLGLEPAAATAAYRIGDSAVNIINPCSVYMAFTLVVIRRFLPEFSLSSLLTQMFPYALSILCAGMMLITTFILFDIPMGFGS